MKSLVLLMIVLCSIVYAQPETFRSLSTSGLILDDFDVWYSGVLHTQPVPDRLLDVEGVRIYTGLSNLSTGTDFIFEESDSTRGGFLLGGSFTSVSSIFALGIVTGFLDDRIYDEITLLGSGGVPFLSGEGFLEGTWSEYVDTNGDGTLDTRHTVHQTAEARTDSSATSAGLYGAYAVSESMRLGFGISYDKTSTETLDADENFSIAVTDSNLVTGAETYTQEAEGEGSFADAMSGVHISASLTNELTDALDMGAMFTFALFSSDVSQQSNSSGSENNLPGEIGVYDYTQWSESEIFSVQPDGQRIGGGLDAKFKIDENWTLEAAGGYYSNHLTGSSLDQYSANLDSSYIVTMGSFIDSTTYDLDASGGMTEIDYGNNVMLIGSKLTMDSSDRFIISMGASFVMVDNSTALSNSAAFSIVQTHSDGDDEFADPDDYISTTTWSQTERTETKSTMMRISVPIGLEFEVLSGLFARLGANPGFVWEEESEVVSLVEASPATTHTVYGDGTENEYVEDPYETVDGTLVETQEAYTDIPFTYGIGYTPNDYIQIDLMGIGESFDQWRLSATLCF